MKIVRRREKAVIPEEPDGLKKSICAKKERTKAAPRSAENPLSVEEFEAAVPASETIDNLIKDPAYYTKRLRAAGIRPRKKKVLGDITYGDVEEAIWFSEGLISAVARRLKVSVFHVQNIFKRNKLLEQEFTEFRERITDEVEGCLLTKIRNGDTIATLFYLKCHGKTRGYIDRETATASKRGVKMRVVKASAASKKTLSRIGKNVVPFVQRVNTNAS